MSLHRKLKRLGSRWGLATKMLVGPWRGEVAQHADLAAVLAAWDRKTPADGVEPVHRQSLELFDSARAELERLSNLYLALAIRVAELEKDR